MTLFSLRMMSLLSSCKLVIYWLLDCGILKDVNNFSVQFFFFSYLMVTALEVWEDCECAQQLGMVGAGVEQHLTRSRWICTGSCREAAHGCGSLPYISQLVSMARWRGFCFNLAHCSQSCHSASYLRAGSLSARALLAGHEAAHSSGWGNKSCPGSRELVRGIQLRLLLVHSVSTWFAFWRQHFWG